MTRNIRVYSYALEERRFTPGPVPHLATYYTGQQQHASTGCVSDHTLVDLPLTSHLVLKKLMLYRADFIRSITCLRQISSCSSVCMNFFLFFLFVRLQIDEGMNDTLVIIVIIYFRYIKTRLSF